jgi:hypothetical protein
VEVSVVQIHALLAFVVLLLLMSVVVTALVQAAIALFDVRGGNVTSALATILRQSGVAQDAQVPRAGVSAHRAWGGG